MANEVYANGMEIACKAASGKSIAAFPDTCLSPPTPPAGPVPLPYPNTAYASDTTNGSATVMISGQEVMLKDQSTFKKSIGDEAATKSLGMGVVTHCIQGEANFIAWSMDVLIEGQNVDRHLDLMLHNEQCDPANTPPIVYVDRMAMMTDEAKCSKEKEAVDEHCGNPPDKEKLKCPTPPVTDPYSRAEHIAYGERMRNDKCHSALRCALTSYEKGKAGACCPEQTPDHLIEASSFLSNRKTNEHRTGWDNYDQNQAPCMCAEGPNQTVATHGELSMRRGVVALVKRDPVTLMWSRKDATETAAKSAHLTFPQCREECITAQLNNYHDNAKTDPNKPEEPIKGVSSMAKDPEARVQMSEQMNMPTTVELD